jgi:hypothetical protein
MLFLSVLSNTPLQELADVIVDFVARVISLEDLGNLFLRIDESLLRALRYDHHTVLLLFQSLDDLLVKPVGSFQFEEHLGDYAEVHVLRSQTRVHGNVSRVATH